MGRPSTKHWPTRARRALRDAFSGRLRFSLDGGARRKTGALVLMTPLVSSGSNSRISSR
jgi:hypothetical protein